MNLNSITIRETEECDFSDIIKIETSAFKTDSEAKLTAALLTDQSAEPILSLLAFHEQEAVGHILFTKGYFYEEKEEEPDIQILAPLAVKPQWQRKRIGGQLIKKGLQILKERGTEIVFVLGHIDYYPKYGFINDATKFGFYTPYPIPEKVKDAWMVQELLPGMLDRYSGKIRCCDEMNREEHWRE